MSVSSNGEQGGLPSGSPSISADGRYIAYESHAINLVPGDTNNTSDVFLHDRETGITARVSVSSSGEQGDLSSGSPSISADGRYVVFSSAAENLVPGDTNGDIDVFIHDRQAGITQRVSVSSTGEQGYFSSGAPSISADGNYVAFVSEARSLVANDTNNKQDIFLHNRQTGATKRVNVSSSGYQANLESANPSISADGRYVVYESTATNLVPADTFSNQDIFIYDREAQKTELASVSTIGEQAGGRSNSPSISADGRYVAFYTGATNLLPVDANGATPDIYIHDRETEMTKLASVSSTGEQGSKSSIEPIVSADGQYVKFVSDAENFVHGDSNRDYDVFVTENPLLDSTSVSLIIEKEINNEVRETPGNAAKLATGTQYKQSYKVTNTSFKKIYQVQVYEGSNLVCNLYTMDSGQSKQRCHSYQTVREGAQHVQPIVMAKVSGSTEVLNGKTDAYYTGVSNVTGKLKITHRINNLNADTENQAPTLGSSQAIVWFKIENTSEIELYQIKTYHHPVSPMNYGWNRQCVIGPLKPGEVRYCQRNIMLVESGLNHSMGRVQGRNAIISATEVVNASNPTYFIVP